MLTGCGIVCFLYCPLLLLLRFNSFHPFFVKLYFKNSYLKLISLNRDPPGKTQQEKDEDLVSDISTFDLIKT